MTPDVHHPRAVVTFEAILTGIATIVLGVLVSMVARTDAGHLALAPLPVTVALCAPVLARFGVSVEGKAQSISVTFETAALVLLLFLTTPLVAVTLWCLLIPFGLITRRWRTTLFNISLTIICGAALALTVTMVGRFDPTDPLTLAAFAAGCSIATLIDLGLSWLHVHLRTGQSVWQLAGADDILIGSGVACGTGSIGYLGGLLHQLSDPWVMLILLVPVGAVIIASRATRQSMDDQQRLSVLLESSRDRRHLTSPEAILDSALKHAHILLGSESVELSGRAPHGNQIGAPIDLGDETVTWLVSEPRRDRSTWLTSERQALDALAADTAESLSRTRLIHELRTMARTDGLSGLTNRTTFSAAVDDALREATGTARYPTLLYLDLNNFKHVNDAFGHHVGDELVRKVASRLGACTPSNGLAARLGGDEFAMLLAHGTDLDRVAENLICALGSEFPIDGHSISVSASIGAAVAGPGISVDRLFRNADLAMYHAKAGHTTGPTIYHDGMRAQDEERNQLRGDLASAVDNGELRLVYQPVQDLRRGTVDGVEALVRWQHPTKGLLPAGAFIDIAEESGLIQQIGDWVLREAMRDGARMAGAAGRPLSVAVNVSPRQLGDDRLVRTVRELVAADTSGTHLVLELTESAVITEDPVIRARLESLVELGVSLALDDFGVGYSSVGYLRWLPMQILKLDRSLLTSIAHDGRARALVEAILAMGRALDLVVVAEGIERADEARILHDLGCPLGQGWWLARPLALPDLEDLLAGPAPMTQPLRRRVAS